MGIRTPDLLHAISRQGIPPRPSAQVTVPERARLAARVQAGCCTFLLGSRSPPGLAGLLTAAGVRPSGGHLRTRKAQAVPGALASRRSAVHSSQPRASARAT